MILNLSEIHHIHFIGIGGIGMSGLARIALEKGFHVTGSDPNDNPAVRRLIAHGATVHTTQTEANLQEGKPDLVVITAAIHEDNAELQAARRMGLPVVSRAEFLGITMSLYPGPRIAVTGAHGKTTTTAMIATLLKAAGKDPTALVGGEITSLGGNALIGGGDVFLTEACEAYGSFLSLHPDITVLTNLDVDHLDYYVTEENLFNSFLRFASQTNPNGCIIWCADDPGATRLMKTLGSEQCSARRISYGLQPSPSPNHYHARNVRWLDGMANFQLCGGDSAPLCDIKLSVPGEHNVLNALASAAAGIEAGLTISDIMKGLEVYKGTARRFELVGEAKGITIVDDYAHHPREITATLKAARRMWPNRRLMIVFQPHLYSRTRDFMREFAESLSEFDAIVLTGIYPAREKPIPGVTMEEMMRRISSLTRTKMLLLIEDKQRIADELAPILHEGDVVMTVGAGDIDMAGRSLYRILREE